jgi:hypothetical protein
VAATDSLQPLKHFGVDYVGSSKASERDLQALSLNFVAPAKEPFLIQTEGVISECQMIGVIPIPQEANLGHNIFN